MPHNDEAPPKLGLFAGLHMADNETDAAAAAPPPPEYDDHAIDDTPKLRNTSRQRVIPGANENDFPVAPTLMAEDNDDDDDQVVTAAPVTDKLLDLLNKAVTEEEVIPEEEEEEEEQDLAMAVPEPAREEEAVVPEAPAPSSYRIFSGWFGSSAPAAPPPASAPSAEEEATQEEEEVVVVSVEDAGESTPTSDPSEITTADAAPGIEFTKSVESEEPYDVAAAAKVAAAQKQQAQKQGVGDEQTTKQGQSTPTEEELQEAMPPKKEMSEAERVALDSAFAHSDSRPSVEDEPTLPPEASVEENDASATMVLNYEERGIPGRIHPNTPIPNSDAALRLLRRFAHKTRPRVVITYGGSKSRSILSYFGVNKQDPVFVPYRRLMDTLYDPGEDRDNHADHLKDDSDRIVDAVMGASGDSMTRARLAVAAFVDLFSTWGHASSRYFEEKNAKAQQAFSELMSAVFEAASQLVAHGCLDGVLIGFGKQENAMEYQRAVHMLAQSVFNADLSLERNELAAMKFLLGTGCRIGQDGDALLRGSHLLQTIRSLYHVFLTTESSPNKTTARAALQQLTTSVFSRVAASDMDNPDSVDYHRRRASRDQFPTENHRDAFLVLRSICKLSMRSVPDANDTSNRTSHNHVGLQSSGSHDTWDEGHHQDPNSSSPRGLGREDGGLDGSGRGQDQHAQLLYTSAIHPALESKLLALELLLYVLQNTKFTKGFIQKSGPQFQAAIRNYLCVSLLKNCTSDNTRVVNLSLRIFVPLVRYFRTILKSEIEAFVTNVFFVILDSKNSPAEHKSIVVKTFDEICSDPTTLAEIFLNYDCDLSAVDLFHRIVNTLSTVSRTGIQEPRGSGLFMGSQSVARLEKLRIENRELRLNAMKALRQVLASLHASIVEPLSTEKPLENHEESKKDTDASTVEGEQSGDEGYGENGRQSLVEIYGSKKKRRAEMDEVILRFNRKPSAGIAYAVKCKHVDGDDPADVARYLLKNKDVFDKTMIGEYLGREVEYQNGFSIKVLHEYTRLLDFKGLVLDEGIRFFLSNFRLPGEAQKIDRVMEKFAERFTEQNPDVFPTADVAFILAFSIIMLQTDLHNPAIKEDRRMTKEGFVRNNRGICDGQDLPEEMLTSIFDRIKMNPFSLKEDDEARDGVGPSGSNLPAALSPTSFFSSHYDDMDRARTTNFQKERDHIVRTTESILKRRRCSVDTGKLQQKSRTGKPSRHAHRFVRAEDTGLRDEYVSPMFDVAWGPALAAFSTAMNSANGTVGALISVASDEELELAAENAAETIEVCLTGFRFAIGTAGLCGNETARDAYMLALASFSQLGTGVLLEPRHIRCIQTMLRVAREDGELLGSSWGHVFRALSEINRFHQVFQLMARNDRAAAAAAERRRRKLEAKEARRREGERRRAAAEDSESIATDATEDENEYSTDDGDDSLAESGLFDDDEFPLDEEGMDARAIDEANARAVYDAVSEGLIEAIYERSSSLSAPAVKDFVTQLCQVSRSEISVRGGWSKQGDHQGKVEPTDLTHVSYRQQHVLLGNNAAGKRGDQFHHSQPNIYNLQKLVEVAHYNMESRPRLIFSELWAIVADHLTFTALHRNPAIAMYAVDSFRQLCIQYLQRDELEVFEFQRRFLKPLETVMAQSKQTSTKELLLNCVARIIHVFAEENSTKQKGGLKSGWMPILAILGLGGQDPDVSVASLGSSILHSAIETCLQEGSTSTNLLLEHFVETVNALLMCVDGPHYEISLAAIQDLITLTEFLADGSTPLPQVKRRSNAPQSLERSKQELELWWPILLGLSRSVGDPRIDLRAKGLESLHGIINRFFFPDDNSGVSCAGDNADENMQTLQLIFRGILTPILEFAETGGAEESVPALPGDFDKFLTSPESATANPLEAVEETLYSGSTWLETTFDMFLDTCVSICLRSIKTFHDFSLVDEVFAILNNCLLSDSGLIAVRGLRRLEQFVTSDLDTQVHSDDVWATVCHMLRRCLAVRGLPSPPVKKAVSASDDAKPTSNGEVDPEEKEYRNSIEEFIAEETFLANRRYVGSNATMTVGLLLTNDHFNIALRWRLFLIAGLGRGIVEWEQAASILEQKVPKMKNDALTPPDYREIAVYGRKWMNRLLLQLAASKEIAEASPDLDPKSNRNAAGQKLVMDETQRLLIRFLGAERAASEYGHSPAHVALYSRITHLVKELLSGLQNMGAEHLQLMTWINPVLLGSCIQSKHEDIRLAVQKLVQSTTPGSITPYPAPSPKKDDVPKSDTHSIPPEENAGNEETASPGSENERSGSDAGPDEANGEEQEDVAPEYPVDQELVEI